MLTNIRQTTRVDPIVQNSTSRPQGASINQSLRNHPMRYCVVNRNTSNAPHATSLNPQNQTTAMRVVAWPSPPTQGNNQSGRRPSE